MADKLRSFTITHGVPRAPNRSMLRAIGYQDADFDKPIVGVANAHSTINPCNAGIQPLADAADAAARAAGAMPQMFGTITVTDGIMMGTEGMNYCLVSREVIADCDRDRGARPEHGRRARHRRLRQEHARLRHGHGAPQHPRDLRLRRQHPARPLRGAGPQHRVASSRRSGAYTAARSTRGRRLHRVQALPGRRLLRRHVHRQHHVLAPSRRWACRCPTPRPWRPSAAEKRETFLAGSRCWWPRCDANLRPRDIITRKSLENAYHGGAGPGRLDQRGAAPDGHRARGRASPWTLDDFDRVRRRVPHLADLKPSGRYVMIDLHRAGGTPQVMKILLADGAAARRLHDRHRQDARGEPRGRPGRAARRPGRDPPVVRPDVRAGATS